MPEPGAAGRCFQRGGVVQAGKGCAFDRVEVAPTKTSVYVGSVSLSLPMFSRQGGVYETTYVAKVFPYFFYNETGRLGIDFSDEQLRRLGHGETVEFTGRAERTDGAARRVEGKVTPVDATSGKIKVRVFYSKRIELIFNTTYRFPDLREPAVTPVSSRQAAGP